MKTQQFLRSKLADLADFEPLPHSTGNMAVPAMLFTFLPDPIGSEEMVSAILP